MSVPPEESAGGGVSPDYAAPHAQQSGKRGGIVALLDTVARTLSSGLAGLFLLILLLVNAQIVCRSLLSISVPWTEEISRLLFIYLIYLGASVAYHERAMITIDTVPALAPDWFGWLKPLAAFTTVLIVAFMFYASIPMLQSSWNTSLATVGWISNGWAYLAFTISFGLMLLHSLGNLLLLLAGKERSP